METKLNFDEAINKIDKILKLGQLFNVVGGDIFFCICSTSNSDVNNIDKQENNDNGNSDNKFDEQVCKRFENNFNTRFTNMVINIKTKPVRVEFIGNCDSKSTELEIIKYYRSNPNFINLVDYENNSSTSSNENNRYIHIRLYSLPKEWSMTYVCEKSFEHSHTHTHEQGHGHHHNHHHNQNDHHHHHHNDLDPSHHHHHHHEDDHSHEHGHSHSHTHTHSHPGSEETYQCMNFH
ncbi:hypothetical protein ACTFIT_004385 [Dictyostelium discoideum]|uniref:Uncharacterized protein n=1 Tax=Dictyostelium discoideum TaxID=44689 RepID=Q8STF5_DICDI|nr:hypothetical protein [Dictyostelium discoideum]